MNSKQPSFRRKLLSKNGSGEGFPHQENNTGSDLELQDIQEDYLKSSNKFSTPEGSEENDRKIDFVLVYCDGDGKQAIRDIYEDNLRNRKLELEDVPSVMEPTLHFVKVHAPLGVLYQKAEDMNIQMPIKKDVQNPSMSSQVSTSLSFLEKLYENYEHLDPFVVDEPTVRVPLSRTRTTFSKTNVAVFESKNGEYFFEDSERSRMVHRLLQLTSFTDHEAAEEIEAEEDDNSGEVGHGIEQLRDDGVYKAYFPLHDGPLTGDVLNDRMRLRKDWASFSRMFKYQPLHAIRSYYGVRVSFYFAWLGAYNMFLIPAAIVGVLCFIYAAVTLETFIPLQEICNKTNEKLFYMCPLCDRHCSYYSLTTSCLYSRFARLFDNGGTVFFSIFMSVWATLFLEYWKRTQASLAFDWDVYGLLKDYEPLRPKFVVEVRETKVNPVTNKPEPHIPQFIRIRRASGALGVVWFMMLIVIGTLIGIIVYRAAVLAALYSNSRYELRKNAKIITSFTAATFNLGFIQLLTFVYVKIAVFLINWENPRTVSEFHNSFTFKMYASRAYDIRRNAKLVTSFTAAAMNLVFIKIFSFVYVKIAVMLTDWENSRTKSQYQSRLTFKMYVFEFVNTYSSLFYIAFFKSSLVIGKPTKQNRMQGRRIEGCDPSGCLTDVCIQLAVIMVGKQILGFAVEFLYPSLVRRWNKWRHKSSQDENKKLPQWESDYLLNPEPDFRMFYEYLEMVIQFGFVTMFVASFPLAPLFALINNIFELRADATNFVVNYRRPVAEEVKNIGIWFKILDILTKISVLVNSFVIAFTTELIPRLVYMYEYSPDGSLKGYVNNSLAYIKISDLEPTSLPDNSHRNLNYTLPYCRFKEYLEPPPSYEYSKQYLHVTLARVVFIIFFQYSVFFIKDLLAWLVPDIPKSLEVKIKRENHVASLCLRKSEFEAVREIDSTPPYHSCESLNAERV